MKGESKEFIVNIVHVCLFPLDTIFLNAGIYMYNLDL